MAKRLTVETFTVGQSVRHDDLGMIGVVRGVDDRGCLDVLRSDGLRVVWHQSRVCAA